MSRNPDAAAPSKDIIKEIAEMTGLPSDIWSPSKKLSIPTLDGYDYELLDSVQHPSLAGRSKRWDFDHSIKIGAKTITTLSRVPAVNVLGYATIIRTPANLTAMVSLAEAAAVSMDENHCQLLWVMMQFIEKGIKSDKNKEFHAYYRCYKAPSEFQTIERLRQQTFLYKSLGKLARLFKETEKSSSNSVYSKQDPQRGYNDKSTSLLMGPEGPDTPKKSLSEARIGSDQNKIVTDSIPMTKAPSEPPRGYFKELVFSRNTQELLYPWAFYESERTDLNVFKYLVEWLELHLGGDTDSPMAAPYYIELQTENPIGSVSKPQIKRGCWRDKVISGNIFQFESSLKEESSSVQDYMKVQYRYRHFIENDCLILTGAALWSLFDNALERLPNCQCTFKTSKDFLQCRKMQDGWFMWHTWSSTSEALCLGENCDKNIRVALSEEEAGHQFRSTSPCALGWFATDREKPDAIIWDKLSPSPVFKKKVLVKYKVKEFQIQAQLSVPLVVAPQICGAVTFAKDSYIIANSIDSASAIAMELVAAAVSLIYDETRGVHRTFDGADLIEMCCMQLLRDIGYDLSGLPYFSGLNAFVRLETWSHSNFVTLTNKLFTGDQLVRQATRRISEIIDATRTAARDNSTLLYWALEDILRTGSSQALKAPRCRDISWHKLAFAAPPIILVVGELKPEVFEANRQPLSWHTIASTSTSTPNSPSIMFGPRKVLGRYLLNNSVRGGVFGSHRTLRRWFIQGQPFSEAALDPTVNTFVCDQPRRHIDIVYHVIPVGKGKKADPNNLFWRCHGHPGSNWEGRCLHYIQ
ncbi:hypothetical protein TWF788_011242 [Orbilia oligospora]|uniref:Uncharacterized protein n=1 Tax=Orbilia oligospora TaxID=2813651 RepID=A0A7C8U2X1_ORBOL|nr:hypothetical protein TWF788_011242 [Orbilia oligospora]